MVPSKNGKPVSPVLGFLPHVSNVDAFDLSRSTEEVDAVFTVPLFPNLANPEFEMFQEYKLPVYPPDDGRDVKIWGLTAFVMHALMRDILVPALEPTFHKTNKDDDVA